MKFYPLKEWRKGQEVVVIDGEKYYTLEVATNWGMNKEQEEKVILAVYRGENWLKKGNYKVTAGDKNRDMEDILGKVFASKATKLVASQPEDSVPALVATTQPAHQDASTIILDLTARKKAEEKKKREDKETAKETAIKENGKKGKEKKKKTFTLSPPLTRARKRMRQTTDEVRTLFQDSCAERKITTDHPKGAESGQKYDQTELGHKDEPSQRYDGTGYTLPLAHCIPRIVRFHNRQMELDFIKKLLKIHEQLEYQRETGIVIAGLTRLHQLGAIENSLETWEKLEPQTAELILAIQKAVIGNTTIGTKGEKESFFIKEVMKLTKDPLLEKPAKKLVWGFMELLKAGAISCSIQDMEKADRENYNKANLTCWVDEFEKQKLDASATKKDIMKMRDEMAVQYQATFKQVVEINEKTEKIAEHNRKMKAILEQVNAWLEHLDQSLLKRSEADRINNNALLRAISDLSEIQAQLKNLHQV